MRARNAASVTHSRTRKKEQYERDMAELKRRRVEVCLVLLVTLKYSLQQAEELGTEIQKLRDTIDAQVKAEWKSSSHTLSLQNREIDALRTRLQYSRVHGA